MLDGKFFIGLAKDVVPMFRKHTFMDALDVKGKSLKDIQPIHLNGHQWE